MLGGWIDLTTGVVVAPLPRRKQDGMDRVRRMAFGLWVVGGLGVCASPTQGWRGDTDIPVRWINPAGGDWNEPTNWDAQRVPLEGEAVVFDLEASYTVTVCGDRPAMWSSFRVNRSEVVFDLCGSALAVQPKGLFKWVPVIRVGRGDLSGVDVVFANGTVFDPESWLLDAEIVIEGGAPEFGSGGSSGGARVRIAPDAQSGPVGRVALTGDSHFTVEGVLEMFFGGQMNIDTGGAVVIEPQGTMIGGKFASVRADGELIVLGTAPAVESTISGAGLVRVEGVLDGWYLFNGVRVRPEGSSLVRTAYIADATVDWRGATSETQFELQGDLGFSVFERVLFEADLCADAPCEGAALVQFEKAFDLGFWDSQFRLSGAGEVTIGEARALMRWHGPSTPGTHPLSMELDLIDESTGPQPILLRVGRLDPQTMAVFALGVPEDWCAADLDLNGVVDFFDVSLMLHAYAGGSPWADINGDMRVDFFDLSDFLALLDTGCTD